MGLRFCKRGNNSATAPYSDSIAASMGPRFCKRGNKVTKHVKEAREKLQWGHAFVSVETTAYTHSDVLKYLLQWGHAFVSVETSASLRRHLRHAGASMGPRFCKRGNWPWALRIPQCITSFNGATLL